MFEIEGDLDLDEDFLDGIFQSECEALKKTETEGTKRTSPEDRSCQSSKKHRIVDESTVVSNNEAGAAGSSNRKSSEKKTCPSENNESLSGGLQFRSGSSTVSQDMFSDNEGVNNDRENKLLLCSAVSSRLTQDLFPSVERTKQHSKKKLLGDTSVFVTPQKQIRQRKFPGPAGLLPGKDELMNRSLNSAIVTPSSPNVLYDVDRVCSQSSSSMFDTLQWLQMVSDYRLADDHVPLSQFTIAWVKRRAAARQLSDQKVPFLGVVLHELDCSSPDPCAKLRDKTGDIHGTLHREVWEQHGGHLCPGSVLVLRQAGVLSTGISTRRHYLNVTSNNILSIYSCTEGGEIRRTVVNSMTCSQLMKSVNDWQIRQSTVTSVSTTAQPQSMFSTVGNTKFSHMRQSQSKFSTNNTVLPSPRQSQPKFSAVGNGASPQFGHPNSPVSSIDYSTPLRPSTSQIPSRLNNASPELGYSPILNSVHQALPLSLLPSTPQPRINRVGNSNLGHSSSVHHSTPLSLKPLTPLSLKPLTPLSLKPLTPQSQVSNVNSTALTERTNFSHLSHLSPHPAENHFRSTEASTSAIKGAISQQNTDSIRSGSAVLSLSNKQKSSVSTSLQHPSQIFSNQELESPASSGRTFAGGFKPKVPLFAKLAASSSGSSNPGQFTPNCRNALSDNFSKPSTSKENKDLPASCSQAELDVLEGLDTSTFFDDF